MKNRAASASPTTAANDCYMFESSSSSSSPNGSEGEPDNAAVPQAHQDGSIPMDDNDDDEGEFMRLAALVANQGFFPHDEHGSLHQAFGFQLIIGLKYS